ncbi:hypothetical protein LCGC14_3128420, partial [marine sediment metagenome]
DASNAVLKALDGAVNSEEMAKAGKAAVIGHFEAQRLVKDLQRIQALRETNSANELFELLAKDDIDMGRALQVLAKPEDFTQDMIEGAADVFIGEVVKALESGGIEPDSKTHREAREAVRKVRNLIFQLQEGPVLGGVPFEGATR